MSQPADDFRPPHANLAALAACTLWILVLSFPMWSGQFLASPASDQFTTGYAWRSWQAEQWKALGHMPQWNPFIFGGLPYIAAMHGDIFYPTAWLRLLLPTAFAMDLGFVLHYVLAGFFAFLFLRRIRLSWTGALVGGLSYQLSGVVASYVHPGHDGKLFVTALLPLALMALYMAIRERRFEGYGLLALSVGLAILSPHPQMAQYMLITAGLFTLYLVFWEPSQREATGRIIDLGLALAAVGVGLLIGAIQMLPFWEYIPFSPRAETYRGFEGATSYAIPWEHLPEFLLASFVGQSADGTYWGSNPIKLHSEYLGLPVLALALLGILSGRRRRLSLWLGGIGLLFLLVTLGGATPFYRLWYEMVPFVKQTRAPGMALYVVVLVISAFAALGVERLERGAVRQFAVGALAIGGAVALLAALGAFGGFAAFLAQGIEQSTGTAVAARAAHAGSAIRWGALWSGAALAGIGALAYAALAGRVKPAVFCLGLAVLVSADLWRNARQFWVFSDASRVHAPDRLIEEITGTPKPYRVFNLGDYVYPASSLMTHGVPQLLGYHGNELHRFDVLLGGRNEWRNQTRGIIWDLFAVQYVIVPAALPGADSIPGFELVLADQPTWNGVAANLYRRTSPTRYARLVASGLKMADDSAVATLLDPRFPPDRVVLLAPEAPIEPASLTEIPQSAANEVSVTQWEAGRMKLQVDPPVSQDAFILVAENWYPDWHAAVDGEAVSVVRGNLTLITVPVPAGASQVELWFDSEHYRIGKLITFSSLILTALAVAIPVVLRRRASG
ncbi:MAG: hypothetical protein JSW71_02500 [Gemmatimonadota bacterium]|nr:MAG: hypothetical protein JSW71_02500 [Gemmatimonadota bacterium]